LTTEEKLANLNQKTTTADGKWEARVKEYEARLKDAEERVKRERQGSKECWRLVSRIYRGSLNDVIEVNKVVETSPPR